MISSDDQGRNKLSNEWTVFIASKARELNGK